MNSHLKKTSLSKCYYYFQNCILQTLCRTETNYSLK